ncbi:hypothetical protein [Streptomyces sp. NPDC045714]
MTVAAALMAATVTGLSLVGVSTAAVPGDCGELKNRQGGRAVR